MAEIMMYTSGSCPYCQMAERLLASKGITDIHKVRVDLDPQARGEMMQRSGGLRTVPQIFIDGTHVGGFDKLSALDRAGRLDPLLQGNPPEAHP